MPKKVSKKILIVEDDEDFLSILQEKFNSEGFITVVARDGQQGVSVAQEEKPDLVISDVLMPKLEGIDMARRIREFNTKAYIMFLSNITDVNYTNNAAKLDKADYLIKSQMGIDEIVEKAKDRLGIK